MWAATARESRKSGRRLKKFLRRRHKASKQKETERISLQGKARAGGCKGDGSGKEKAEELDGAGGVFARGPVATVNARRSGRLLKLPRYCLALTNV
eukprot:3099189-Pleurochrysis_carterae.AAC.1